MKFLCFIEKRIAGYANTYIPLENVSRIEFIRDENFTYWEVEFVRGLKSGKNALNSSYSEERAFEEFIGNNQDVFIFESDED